MSGLSVGILFSVLLRKKVDEVPRDKVEPRGG